MQIYPDGFTPYYTLQETDFQVTSGLRGETAGWNINPSSTYGRNYVKNGAENTFNASCGPTSPPEFTTFSSRFTHWTNNTNLHCPTELGRMTALQGMLGQVLGY